MKDLGDHDVHGDRGTHSQDDRGDTGHEVSGILGKNFTKDIQGEILTKGTLDKIFTMGTLDETFTKG